jgi:hypothetical protein
LNGITFIFSTLVQICFLFTPVTLCSTPEKFITAVGTNIPSLFVSNPFLGADFAAVRNCPQYDFLTYGHGKFFDVSARKLGAFMTSGITFLFRTIPDFTLLAMHETVVGQAAAAFDVLNREVFTIGKRTLVGNTSPVEIHQSLFELLVIVPVRYVNRTDSAIKAARGNKVLIYVHHFKPLYVPGCCASNP